MAEQLQERIRVFLRPSFHPTLKVRLGGLLRRWGCFVWEENFLFSEEPYELYLSLDGWNFSNTPNPKIEETLSLGLSYIKKLY